MTTYPKCDHCGKRVWFDPYGPGWVHFRGTFWCYGIERLADGRFGNYAEVSDDEA